MFGHFGLRRGSPERDHLGRRRRCTTTLKAVSLTTESSRGGVNRVSGPVNRRKSECRRGGDQFPDEDFRRKLYSQVHLSLPVLRSLWTRLLSVPKVDTDDTRRSAPDDSHTWRSRRLVSVLDSPPLTTNDQRNSPVGRFTVHARIGRKLCVRFDSDWKCKNRQSP